MHACNRDLFIVTFLKNKNNNFNSSLKPYTVHYRNFENIRIENCFYASDAYEAKTLAIKFNKYIHDHPNSIDLIKCIKN